MGYFTFTLLAIFLIALLDKSLPIKSAAAVLGLLIGFILHYAGYFILIIFGLSIFIIVPIVYIFNPALIDLKKMSAKLLIGGMVGLLISLSKLAAVYSFMRFFPRTIADHYDTHFLTGIVGIFLQLLGTMNILPLLLLSGSNPDTLSNFIYGMTRADYGFWEVDMSVTPIVFIILLIGLTKFFYYPKKYLQRLLHGQKKIASLFLVFSLWLAVEFTLAKGLFYPILQNWPILSSLHVNLRFAAVFIFPFGLAAVLIYDKLVGARLTSKLFTIFLVVNILALLPLGLVFVLQSVHER